MPRRHVPETPREVVRRLLADGWIERAGKGDHRNFTKPGHPVVITVDVMLVCAKSQSGRCARSTARRAGNGEMVSLDTKNGAEWWPR